MKKIAKSILSVVMALAMVILPVITASAHAADDINVVARFTFGGEVYEYESLADAIFDAEQVTGVTVYLASDYTLPSDLVIPSNVAVTIPTSDAYNDNFEGVDNKSGNGQLGSAYVTLTIPEGITLNVEGVLLVAGNQQGTNPRTGFLTGDYGAVNLEGSLVVNGTLYARGDIYGEGTVTATSGGEVYQRFQIADWRGGTGSLRANNVGVFPFNLYTLGGISTKAVYENGSALNGLAYIYAYSINNYVTVPYMGKGGIIGFNDDDNNGSISFIPQGDRTLISVDASIHTGELSIDLEVAGTTYTVSSLGLDCPFGYLTDVVVNPGSSVTVDNLLKVLPGCSIILEEGSNLTLAEGKALYFYGADSYEKDYYWGTAATWDISLPATLVNNGAAITLNGTVASSVKSFDNVEGFTADGDKEVIVDEYDQYVQDVEGENPLVSVPFYVGTPITTTSPTPAE